MTVAEFKRIVAGWPVDDPHNGEDAEVWVETGWCLSSQLAEVRQLNAADMILISRHEWEFQAPARFKAGDFTKEDGAVRYVVEIKAEGGGSFLMIYSDANLEPDHD